jgi:hypothetical protein
MQKVKKTRPGSTGSRHWNFKTGNETLAAKQERSERSLRLHYLSQMGHELGFMNGRRMVGRKPVNYVTLDYKNKDHLVYVMTIINQAKK